MSDEKVSLLADHIADVKNVMAANIDRVLARGERLDTVAHKSHELQSHAAEFRKNTYTVRADNKKKLYVVATACVIVFIILILIIVSLAKRT